MQTFRLRRLALSPAVGCHVLMLAVLLTALAARLFHLANQSLWVDEGFAAYLVTLPLDRLLKGLATDHHPPLYYLLLQGWTTLVGHSEFALRSLSVGFGVLAVAVVYRLTRQLFDPAVAVASAALLTVSPIHIWYAQETWVYTLLGLLTVLSVDLTLNLLQRPQGRTWLAYWLLATTMLYTEYVAAFVILFESLIALTVAIRGQRWEFLRRWIAVQGLVGLAFLPWVPTVLQQMGYHLTWIERPRLLALGGTVLRVLFGAQESYLVPAYLGLVGVCLLLLGAGGVLYLWHDRERWASAGFVILWLTVPVGLITGVSQAYPIYRNKQLLMLLPAALILVALALKGQGKIVRTITLCLLIGLWAIPLQDQYFTLQKQDWRSVAAYIDAHAATSDVIYVNASGGALALRYYLRTPLPEAAYPSVFTVEEGGYVGEIATAASVDARLAPLARQYQRIWLLGVAAEFWDPEGYIKAWLGDHCTPVAIPTFHALDVGLYDTRPYREQSVP